jgi:hypothetical protein
MKDIVDLAVERGFVDFPLKLIFTQSHNKISFKMKQYINFILMLPASDTC